MKKGFTLIELLVVIGIIAILSAIIFPVFARAKSAAYRSSDMSNMNTIRTELQLYKADQEAYPPVLLGYVNAYGPQGVAGIVPANLLVAALYPKLVNSLDTLRPSLDQSTFGAANQNLAISQAYWPEQLNSLQAFGPGQQVMGCYPESGNSDNPLANYYYMISGYDVENLPFSSLAPTQPELHYTLFWSINAVPTDPCNPGADSPPRVGSSSDTPRQLGYADPPESTVVTWDSMFRDRLEAGQIPNNKGDMVLFLGGAARPYPSQVIGAQSWQAMP